jgi:hypothetical protein
VTIAPSDDTARTSDIKVFVNISQFPLHGRFWFYFVRCRLALGIFDLAPVVSTRPNSASLSFVDRVRKIKYFVWNGLLRKSQRLQELRARSRMPETAMRRSAGKRKRRTSATSGAGFDEAEMPVQRLISSIQASG